MTNATYPQMTLNTVEVTVIDPQASGIEQANKAHVTVAPNPATDYIVIEGTEVLKAQIYSLAGACVKSVEAGVQTIDVADLASGMYLVQISTPEGVQSVKFIKK